MRFEKPKKKSGRPGFVDGRIAELERQLATETNETRKSELLQRVAAKPTTTKAGRREQEPRPPLRATQFRGPSRAPTMAVLKSKLAYPRTRESA